jgi:hypothetical protein
VLGWHRAPLCQGRDRRTPRLPPRPPDVGCFEGCPDSLGPFKHGYRRVGVDDYLPRDRAYPERYCLDACRERHLAEPDQLVRRAAHIPTSPIKELPELWIVTPWAA